MQAPGSKNFMTKLYFRYNPFYDRMLSRLANESFNVAVEQDGGEFIKKIQSHWDQYNDQIFGFYKTKGFVLPEYWLAYPVHAKKGLIPFDDPLTFIIGGDFEAMTATVVHELGHIFFGYYENKDMCGKLWEHIDRKFEAEDEDTKKHLIVIPLAMAGLHRIFTEEKVLRLAAMEKNYEGLERAWAILGKKPLKAKEDPVQYILSL